MKAITFALPPLDEQEVILKIVEESTEGIQRAIIYARQETELHREYRTRLVADVVTGKLDMRAVAAGLPETSSDEPIDDATEAEDLDEETMGEADAEDVAA
jgi:type I restriction enzyme S subunit